MRACSLILLSLLTLCPSGWTDSDATEKWKQMMGLLPGYRVTENQGIDSVVGNISKGAGRLTIHFDIFGATGNQADSEEVEKSTIWRREQKINGARVICVYTKSRDLIVTFPLSANFVARIRNQQDLADMLLMVLTFHSPASSPGQKGTAPK